MAAKAVKVAGPGAPGIDKSRRSAPPSHLGRIDAERGSAPIDMRVEVDQPRHHEEPARIDGVGATEVPPDLGDLAPPKAMSAISSRPLAGSMTRPPFRIRSVMIARCPRLMGNVV